MPSSDFTATLITVDENADAFTVGLAENESETETGEGAFLILQCAVVPPTDQDVATGMDTYCLMDENGATRYGGIERVELASTTSGTGADAGAGTDANTASLRIRFDEDAADEFGVESTDRQLTLALPAARTADLAAGLRRVLTYGPTARHPELIGI